MNMKASELRIGNYFMVNWSKEIRKADCLDIRDIAEGRITCGVSPIELSPEILEKAGFRYDGYVWDTDKVMFGDYKDGVHYCNGFYIGNKGIKIEFVHQLQNLYFALTGQELTINLK